MAARLRARTAPRFSNSSTIVTRWRCSTMIVSAAIISRITSTVPQRSFAWRETNLNGSGDGVMWRSRLAIQPDLPERDIGIAQAVDLDAPDVRLEKPLVRVVQNWNDRRVLEDQFLRPPVEVHPACEVRLPPRPEQQVVHHRVGIAEEIAGASGVEELEEKVVRIRDIGEPRVQENGELPFAKHLGKGRPVRQVLEVSLDSHRIQVLLDLLMLAKDPLEPDARPDRDWGEPTSPGVPRLGKELPCPHGVIGVPLEFGVEAQGSRRQDPARGRVAPQRDVLDDGLLIDRMDQRLADSTVFQGFPADVEAVKPDALHRALNVDVFPFGHDARVVLSGDRSVLERSPLKLFVHGLEFLAGKDPVHNAGEPRRTVEIVRVGRENNFFPPFPADEPERARPHGTARESFALLLYHLPRHDLGVPYRQDRHEGSQGLGEGDLDSVSVNGHQSRDLLCLPVSEFLGAPDAEKEVGDPRFHLRVEESREGIDDVVGCDLAAMMELHALPEREGPAEAVARRLPVLGQGRSDGQGLVEPDEAVEDLLGHRPAVDVGDASGIQGHRVVPEWTAIDPAIPILGEYGKRGRGEKSHEKEKGEEGGAPSPLPPHLPTGVTPAHQRTTRMAS